MSKAKSKPKLRTPAKRKAPVRDISANGQLEVRGNEVIFYEPFASELTEICKRNKTTVRQFLIEAILEKQKRDPVTKSKL